MAATEEQVDLVQEWTGTDKSDEQVAAIIEQFALPDESGEDPLLYDRSTSPATSSANPAWIPTYDLHAAAARILEGIAATLMSKFNFSSDDQRFNLKDQYDNCMSLVRHHKAQRAPRAVRGTVKPKPRNSPQFGWIGNLPEEDI